MYCRNKTPLHQKHKEKLFANLSALKEYYRKVRDRSIKKVSIDQIRILSSHSGETGPRLWDSLRKTLVDKGYPELSICDLEEIKRKCQEEKMGDQR